MGMQPQYFGEFAERVGKPVFAVIPVNMTEFYSEGILAGDESGYCIKEFGRIGKPMLLEEDAWVYTDRTREKLVGIVEAAQSELIQP